MNAHETRLIFILCVVIFPFPFYIYKKWKISSVGLLLLIFYLYIFFVQFDGYLGFLFWILCVFYSVFLVYGAGVLKWYRK